MIKRQRKFSFPMVMVLMFQQHQNDGYSKGTELVYPCAICLSTLHYLYRQQNQAIPDIHLPFYYIYPPESECTTSNQKVFFHSVHLARRVLALEKINTQLRQDLEREKTKIKQLAEEVSLLFLLYFE